ncbi:MAG: molybdenum cofactor guanylyltransferase [Dissulfuribacterales bacterium]
MEHRTSVILAGGRSSRFGSNKANTDWNGHTILETIVTTLKKISDEIIIVANDSAVYSHLGLPIIMDRIRNAGPMAGILSALYAIKGQRALCVACDMPLLNASALDYMWGISTWAPVVAPEHNGRIEPLHAIYHKSLRYPIEYAIKKKWFSLQRFFLYLPLRTVSAGILQTFCEDGLNCFANINTQEEYQRLKLLVKKQNLSNHKSGTGSEKLKVTS